MKLWQIHEDTFDPEQLHVEETVYTIGNGYFGTRGSFEEGYLGATPATLLFGIFDDIPIGKEELANAPDWLPIKLRVNGKRFRLEKGTILSYHRTLDMYNGILTRIVHWESPDGIRLTFHIERFASLADPHVGAIRYSVTAEEQPPETGEIDLRVSASLNTAVGNNNLMHWETVDQNHESELIWMQSQTRHSHVQLVQTMTFTSETAGFRKEVLDSDIAPSIRFFGKLSPGQTFTGEKIVVMYTSRDTADPRRSAIAHHHQIEHMAASGSQLSASALPATPYTALLTHHKHAWHEYWNISDIIIEGDDTAQTAVRYNLYQLRLSASPNDSHYSIAAKGLTGFGYRGHIFHDTEIFMLPYFTYVHPHIARNLLLYRYHLLPAARAKAEHNGYEGAQYPWESTLDGLEATPITIIHPESGELIPVLNGQIELHITASIGFAVWQYWYVTDDNEFMRDYGAEILLSIAKFWASRAEWHPERHDYEINNVIGPDEWHEHVNNNAYTNYIARWNIEKAREVLDWLQANAPHKAQELIAKLDLTEQQFTHWRDVVARLRIPQDKQTGLFEQFDGFFQLKPLDREKYKGRAASYQAILGMQPVQEHRIIKQADVLMLLTLLNNQFDLQTRRVNWDYYYPITDNDYGSSLTPALHVILACELGLIDTAYELFMKGALIDLENLRLNTADGIHVACCGAVWQAAVLGFAGLCLTDDGYTTQPHWPDGWKRLAFKFKHKGELVSVDLSRP